MIKIKGRGERMFREFKIPVVFFLSINLFFAAETGTENSKDLEKMFPTNLEELGLADTPRLQAAIYYIDFDGGADSNNGLAPAAAFKHSPGDPEAKEKAAEVKLRPGDTVLFKGGVVYRGNITAQYSGSEANPIVYNGNSKANFGTGRAIVDGSEPLTGWKKCVSEKECDGNPNWNNIWWTEVPFPVPDPMAANLYEAGEPLEVAEDPKPKYLYWPDPFNEAEYFGFDVNLTTSTSIQDEKHLLQTDPRAWDGGVVLIRSTDYWVNFKVTGFDPALHKITFPEFKDILAKGMRRNSRGEGYYAMMNAVVILKYPGQYVVKSGEKKSTIYLWPLKNNAAPEGITITRRRCGFNPNGQSNLTIEGFLIQKFVNPRGPGGGGIIDLERKQNGGLVIRDNIITRCNKTLTSGKFGVIFLTGQKGSLVEKNQIYDNRDSVGVEIEYGTGHIIKDNLICRNGGVCILLWVNSKDCQVIGNTIKDNNPEHLDAHSPVGILVYKGCSNILIKGNLVVNNGQRPLALYSPDSDITIACNVFRHKGPYVMEGFGDCKNVSIYNNVTVCDNPNGRIFQMGIKAVKENNIYVASENKQDKGAGYKLDDGHNLYLAPGDMNSIFTDPEHQDFTLKRGSPAIGAGIANGINEDAAGKRFGKVPDIGAFVYIDR